MPEGQIAPGYAGHSHWPTFDIPQVAEFWHPTGHWGIEDRLHWVRDLDFGEDRSQVRTASGPRIMASLRNLAITILRLSGAASIAAALRYHDRRPARPLRTIMRCLNDFAGALGDQPQVRGWINYYGAFYRSELRFLAWRINEHLARWAMHKFKRFRGKYAKAMAWLQKVYQYQPGLFAHWHLVAFTADRTVGAG